MIWRLVDLTSQFCLHCDHDGPSAGQNASGSFLRALTSESWPPREMGSEARGHEAPGPGHSEPAKSEGGKPDQATQHTLQETRKPASIPGPFGGRKRLEEFMVF